MRKAADRYSRGDGFGYPVQPRLPRPANDNDPFEPPPAASAGLPRLPFVPAPVIAVAARAA